LRFLKKIIFFANILLVIGLLISYLSPFFDPNQYWIFSIFGLFYPVLLLANVAMIVFWMFVKFKYLFASLIAILIGWNHLEGFINFSSVEKNKDAIEVMSYNVNFLLNLRNGTKKQKLQSKEKFESFLSFHSDVDIFCLQETSSFSRDIMKKTFKDYHSHEIDQKGTFILSKFPLLRKGQIDFGTRTNSCLWADMLIEGDTVRVYSMHLQSNKVSADAVDVIDNANLQEKKTWNGIRGILTKYSSTSKIRAQEAKMVRDHAANSPYQTMLIGDFNDPPTSFIYKELSDGYKDSFKEAGAGIGTTYAGKLPMLRIDYILVEENWDVLSFKVLKEDYSDHYAIVGSYLLESE